MKFDGFSSAGVRAFSASASPSAIAALMLCLLASTAVRRAAVGETAGDRRVRGDSERGLRHGAGDAAVSVVGGRFTGTTSSSLELASLNPVNGPVDGVRVGSATDTCRFTRALSPTVSTVKSWGLSALAAFLARPANARKASSAASGRAVR